MNLKELKQKALEKANKALDYWAEKLSNSSYTITSKQNLDKIIKKSANTKFIDKETKEEKIYKHKSIVIFADKGSLFFKEALYIFPVIATKAFSQSIAIKLAYSEIEWVDLSTYNIEKKDIPCLVIFEEEKVLKVIKTKENILKLVKSIDLNINKLIETL